MIEATANGAPEGEAAAQARARRLPLVAGPLPLVQRLGFRLAALLAVALLPIGAISLLQAKAWLDAAREQQAAVLMGDTLRVASPTTGLIQAAQGAAQALARTIPPILGDEAACDATMDAIASANPQYSVVAFVPLDGRMRCASNGASFDYGGISLFEEIVADLKRAVHVQARGPVSGTSIILIVEPVAVPPDGAPIGYVAVAIPHRALGMAPPPTDAPSRPDPAFLTFNQDGVVLSVSEGDPFEPATLPSGVALADLAMAGRETSFSAPGQDGQDRLYAMVPVLQGELYALGSVPANSALTLGPVPIFTPFLLAGLMWLGSLVVAWVAAEHLVSRYIRRLGRAIRAFASGSRVVGDLDMENAPAEIREVGRAFLRMTDTILHDEAELEDTVHQREVLLREVHHRVKNNLQLIASIMNMQARRAKSPETKALMRGLQERVMSLATVHKELYQTTGLADVRADELLGDLVRQIVGMATAPGRTFRIETDFAPIHLVPDQAVPLALLLTEALTNAIKYAEPLPGEPSPTLSVLFLPRPEGRAALVLRNSAPQGAVEPPVEGTGLGKQLVTAFATQLGGEVKAAAIGDGHFELSLEFALRELQGAEQRHSP